MRRIQLNMCGYSGFICRGIPSLFDQGRIFEEFDPVVPDVRGIYSCGDALFNFGHIAKRIRAIDTSATVHALKGVQYTDTLIFCATSLNPFSGSYVTVVLSITPYIDVTGKSCYYVDDTSVLHVPGILDPGQSIDLLAITATPIHIPTTVPVYRELDTGVPALAFGQGAAGNAIAASAAVLNLVCLSDFSTQVSLIDSDENGNIYKLVVAPGRWQVLGAWSSTGSAPILADGKTEKILVQLPPIKEGLLITVYVVCVILRRSDVEQADGTTLDTYHAYILHGQDLSPVPTSDSDKVEFVYRTVSTVTLSCSAPDAHKDTWNKGDMSPKSAFKFPLSTAWLLSAFSDWLSRMLSAIRTKCAARVSQYLCNIYVESNLTFAASRLNASSLSDSGAAFTISTTAGSRCSIVLRDPAASSMPADYKGGSSYVLSLTLDSLGVLSISPVGITDNKGIFSIYGTNNSIQAHTILENISGAADSLAILPYYKADGAHNLTIPGTASALIVYDSYAKELAGYELIVDRPSIIWNNKGILTQTSSSVDGILGWKQLTGPYVAGIPESATAALLSVSDTGLGTVALPTSPLVAGQALGWDGTAFTEVQAGGIAGPTEDGIYFAVPDTTQGVAWLASGLSQDSTPSGCALYWTGTSFDSIPVPPRPVLTTMEGQALGWDGSAFFTVTTGTIGPVDANLYFATGDSAGGVAWQLTGLTPLTPIGAVGWDGTKFILAQSLPTYPLDGRDYVLCYISGTVQWIPLLLYTLPSIVL